MPDWSALRRRARALHLHVRTHLSDVSLPLLPADALLSAAAQETGLIRESVPPGDSLLAGAHAVLDRDMGCIWYARDGGISAARQRFAQAHEFAHYWLHPGSRHCDTLEDEEDLLAPPLSASAQIAQGYSPAERRESEANIFAAEFLLPASALRAAFLHHNWDVSRIVAHTGLSESCVLSQLTEALLLPEAEGVQVFGHPRIEEGKREEYSGQGERTPEHLNTRTPEFQLDASQRAAAQSERGPILVDAGPGTGKTRTLVARMLYLLEERQAAPENILALTFSNKAAEEMRTRLADIAPEQAERVWIGTFHAFGMEMLRKEGIRLSLPLAPNLLETADAVALLERHLDRLHLNEFAYWHDPSLPFADILRCISRAKDELKTPEAYAAEALAQWQTAGTDAERLAGRKSREVAQIYTVYQQLLQANGLLDFGDLLMRPVELLDKFPVVGAQWRARFPHILADEYQDVNRASAQLLRRLSGDGAGLWAVGDLRQAIYRFRGASPANVREFEQDFPGGRRLQLGVNYRSRPGLVSLFSAAAMQTSVEEDGQKAESLWQAQREDADHPSLSYQLADDEEMQADALAAQIRNWEAMGKSLREQAILCRTNAQATDLSERLAMRGVPALHLGEVFERAEVKDMLALLALACDPTGRELFRVAQFAEYGVPAPDVLLLLGVAKAQSRAFPGALSLAAELPELSEPGRQGLLRLQSHIEPLTFHGNAWQFLTRYLFEKSGYLHTLLRHEGNDSRQKQLALYLLVTFAQGSSRRFEEETAASKLRAFLDYIRRLRACKEDNLRLPAGADELEGVRVMTVHASKGLEFPIVYLPNLVKGQFPPRSQSGMASPLPSLCDTEAGEESKDNDVSGERALFFVALSRARDHLALSRPLVWKGKPVEPSPLLAELLPNPPSPFPAHSFLVREGGDKAVLVTINDVPASDRKEISTLIVTESALSPPSLTRNEWAGKERGLIHPSSFILHPSPGGLGEFSLSAIGQYQRCPRQFYYQRVVGLSAKDNDSPYLEFHQDLQEMMRWIQEAQAEGRAISDEEKALQLEARWTTGKTEADADRPTAHTRILREQAQTLTANLPAAPEAGAKSLGNLELTADLPHGRLRLQCDYAEELSDGTLRLERHIKRKPKADDHTEIRLALLRLAAKQQFPERPIEIRLRYLSDGSTRDVPESKRFEPARVEKYDKSLQSIQAGEFAPAPDARKCAHCPFFFLCPA